MKSHSQNKVYYFDYNATHPPIAEILKLNLEDYLSEYYNPSGSTRYSLRNQGKIEKVRKQIAELTTKSESDFVFSSTGTEANYLLVEALRKNFPQFSAAYVSPFEHSSMYDALDDKGIQKIVLQTDKSGLIDLADLEHKLKKEALPVICLYAGNETGVIQPIEQISSLAKEFKTIVLSDLMQAVGKIPVPFSQLDGFSFSGHKIGGGLGTSVTYISNLGKSVHLFGGGNQENGHRAGTENVTSILSLGQALHYQLDKLEEKNKRLLRYRSRIETSLENLDCEIIAKNSPRLPNTSFVKLPISNVDFFLLGLEESGILISTGSSCKSRAREASASLLRMGFTEEEALRCVRISTGYYTTEEEVEFLLEKMEFLLKSFSE
ncbi:MAG: aminotransferase class V-fold PLP-dependent enzyme [Leptospira sp.]|nr:aminotransferase class V-fold PLP-dependent enzyme [Leptospira sp.]